MADRKQTLDMSTPEGIKEAFEYVRKHTSDPARLMKAVNLAILKVLYEQGVEEAGMLEERLDDTAEGSGEALYANIDELAGRLTEEQGAAPTGDQHIDLKRMAGIASAVSDITAAAFVGAAGDGDKAAEKLYQARVKFEEMGTTTRDEANKIAIIGVIDDVVKVLPVPE